MFDLVPNGSSWIGTIGGILTTICWLPQVVRLIRHRETHAISLATNLIFVVGLAFWLAYGITINDWRRQCGVDPVRADHHWDEAALRLARACASATSRRQLRHRQSSASLLASAAFGGIRSRAGSLAHQHSPDRLQPNDAPQRAQTTVRSPGWPERFVMRYSPI